MIFGSCGTVSSLLCRYRKYTLSDGHGLVVRCAHDAVLPPATRGQSPNQFINIKALNEWDPKVRLPLTVRLLVVSPFILYVYVYVHEWLFQCTMILQYQMYFFFSGWTPHNQSMLHVYNKKLKTRQN